MRFAASHDVAKAFGKYQDEALAEDAVTVTRYGRPTVVIVSYAEYERLAAVQPVRNRVARKNKDMPAELLAELDRVIDEVQRRVDARRAANVPTET